MTLFVNDIAVGLLEDQETRWQRAVAKADLRPDWVKGFYTAKRSVDARRKDRIRFLYTIALELKEGVNPKLREGVRPAPKDPPLAPAPGTRPMANRPVIAGFGPAGMFCGLLLARMGYRPLILERGRPMEERVRAVEAFFAGGPLQEESNVQFGEGGAGTFSDGKLTTRIGDPGAASSWRSSFASEGRRSCCGSRSPTSVPTACGRSWWASAGRSNGWGERCDSAQSWRASP